MNASPNNKWLAIILLLLCVTVLLGYVTELQFMMNYLDVGPFWRLGLTSGGMLGLVVGMFAARKSPSNESVARLRVFFMIFFFFLLIAPLLLSWSNRIPAPTPNPTNITIESEQARYSSRFGNVKNKATTPNTHILFFVLDQQLYRISSKKAFFPDAETGDQAILNISEGRWGYRWVDRSHD